MLRDKNLIPLSRQHQHALALCVRIDRASPIQNSDLEAWQAEIVQQFRAEIRVHFAAEEEIVFRVARAFPELVPLVEELQSDHEWLRDRFAQAEAQNMPAEGLLPFATRLSAHIRKEERQLFERLQGLLNPEELERVGKDLEEALQEAGQNCMLATRATRLRAAT